MSDEKHLSGVGWCCIDGGGTIVTIGSASPRRDGGLGNRAELVGRAVGV